MSIPHTLPGQIANLYDHVAELNRRFQNKERTGKVVQYDENTGEYRVQLSVDENTGEPYLSPWIKSREIGAGKNKTHIPHSIGEQVALVSQSGDLLDAEIDRSLASDENPAPSKKSDEYILGQVGPFEIRVSDGGDVATIKVGNTYFKLTEGQMEIGAPTVLFTKTGG